MQPPRGTRDFGPEKMAQRRQLEQKLRRVLATFNFHEVQTPTFEELELFTAKSGEGVKEEMYAFKDKGGRDLCLRPELTAPTMRFYFSELRTRPKPLRLYYFGACYRYDRPQEGRYREFWQLGTELIGDPSPEAHAELLWLALSLLRKAGLENIQLRIGHLSLLRSALSRLGFSTPESQRPLMRLIDKKELAPLREQLLAQAPAAEVGAFLESFQTTRLEDLRPVDAVAEAGAAHLRRVWQLLAGFGADMTRIRVDPTIARGLEYYTGLVFELDCPDLGAQKQLLGGGEYDLSGVFEAQPAPTVGFGLGFDRTLVALEKAGRLAPAAPGCDVAVLSLHANGTTAAQRLANELRDLGRSVELVAGETSFKKALQRASQAGAKWAVILGERELAKGAAALKDLATTQQVELPLATLAAELGRRLGPNPGTF